ncbi:MAG: Glu/Leu/Phe/Val dehydrogenase [Rhizobiales bacterium]|nr:Glu/Leu/Phe/Val dehydrogenase [Hyphomicrobiales bacterium]
MENIFDIADNLGPEKVVHIHRPGAGLRAIVVIDNVARGPSIGGARMAPDVSFSECARLARAMTLKNAAAGLSHGGGKSVIFADPNMSSNEKEALIRAFASAIASLDDYIVGPDMGTNETCMAWVHEEIGRAVGLPADVGGIPLDEIGATGLGVAAAAAVAEEFCEISLKGARVAVQGFGAVGRHAANFLSQKGAVLVAAADSKGTVHNPDGIVVADLIRKKHETGSLNGMKGAKYLDPEDVVGVDCDIWIPAARPDVLRADNIDRLKAKLVIQGANIPATQEAEQLLHQQGILSVPDFIANAGGVICAAVEYHGGSRQTAFSAIEEKITENTRAVLQAAAQANEPPRKAAYSLAEARVRSAMALRRWR